MNEPDASAGAGLGEVGALIAGVVFLGGEVGVWPNAELASESKDCIEGVGEEGGISGDEGFFFFLGFFFFFFFEVTEATSSSSSSSASSTVAF